MKILNLIISATFALGFFGCPKAKAEDSAFKMTAQYIAMVEEMFEKDHSDELGNFVSVKGKPDGMDTTVTVTLLNGKIYTYPCMIMDGAPMCHRQ